MAHTATAVTLDEYLRTSYRPDVEYLNGELKEKPVVGFPHGEVQGLLCVWFHGKGKQWSIRVAVDTRTQVEKGRVRLPDIVVVGRQERAKGALQSAPLVAIEVLSPSDTYSELKSRAADLQAMGTENVWLIDPELRTAEVWNGRSWEPHSGHILQVVNSPIHVDLAWLWAELDD